MDVGTRVKHKTAPWGVGTIIEATGGGYVLVMWPTRGRVYVRVTNLLPAQSAAHRGR